MMRFSWWLDEPQPILRLELVRILAPLAILGFLSSRLAHAGEWVGDAGFRVPNLYGDARQPIDVPALGETSSIVFGLVVVGAALAVSSGFHARKAAFVLALAAAYAALGDRVSTFTVTKLTPVIGLALAASPCGAAYGVDAWLRKKANPDHREPRLVAGGSVRFFQVLLCTLYCASGLCKAQGDWLGHPLVLWTHLHDDMQTRVSVFLANAIPAAGWTAAQAAVLLFESLAPLWFAWRRTRTAALIFGLAMHAFIALTFWPVRWFALLMASLLLGSFLPERALALLQDVGRSNPKSREHPAPGTDAQHLSE
jgi:hypothetical protein